MIVAFDVDDTLLLPPEATGLTHDIQNNDTVDLYRWFQRQGHTMVVWSGGGVEYARMWADRLDLRPDMVIPKKKAENIDIAFDDCDVDLGRVNVKVKRLNNSVIRTLPKERKADVKD